MGSVGLGFGTPSRSEYRPTLMTQLSDGRVRVTGTKGRDGRELWEVSVYGKNRMVAFVSDLGGVVDSAGAVSAAAALSGTTLGSGEGVDSCELVVCSRVREGGRWAADALLSRAMT